MFGVISADTLSYFTLPTLAGFFFCLAPAEGAGLFFCPATYQPRASVYSGFSAVHAKFIRSKRQNRLQGFTAEFLLICHIPAHTIQQTRKPPIHRLRHAGGHTVKRCTSTDTRYRRHAGRCTGQRSRSIIIMYIRVQGCAPVVDPCQTVQHSADYASPAVVCSCYLRLVVGALAYG